MYKFLITVFTTLFLTLSLKAQTSDEKIRAEIFQRAETFYANEQYSQAADLLDRLNVLKIPYDFKSIYLKIKALSNVYNISEKYYVMMESSINAYMSMRRSPENVQKTEELYGIIENFRNSKSVEVVAYEKAKNGNIKDKEEFLSKFAGSVYADEIRSSKDANVVKAHESMLLKLEEDNKKLKADFKRTKKQQNANSFLMVTATTTAIVGIVGLADYEDGSEYNMFKNKSTAGVITGVGTVLAIWGTVGIINKFSKREKLRKGIEENEKKIEIERKRVVWISPYSSPQFIGGVGLTIGMRF